MWHAGLETPRDKTVRGSLDGAGCKTGVEQSKPMVGEIPRFFAQLGGGCLYWGLLWLAASAWQLPSESVEDIAVLPDQCYTAVAIDRGDTNARRFHSNAVVCARKSAPVRNGIAPYRKKGTRKFFLLSVNDPGIGQVLRRVSVGLCRLLLH
jgi:hypothetical protein